MRTAKACRLTSTIAELGITIRAGATKYRIISNTIVLVWSSVDR